MACDSLRKINPAFQFQLEGYFVARFPEAFDFAIASRQDDVRYGFAVEPIPVVSAPERNAEGQGECRRFLVPISTAIEPVAG